MAKDFTLREAFDRGGLFPPKDSWGVDPNSYKNKDLPLKPCSFDWNKPYYKFGTLDTPEQFKQRLIRYYKKYQPNALPDWVDQEAGGGRGSLDPRTPPPSSQGLSYVPYLAANSVNPETLRTFYNLFVCPKLEAEYSVSAEIRAGSVKLRVESQRAKQIRQYHPPTIGTRAMSRRSFIKEWSEKSRDNLMGLCRELEALGDKPSHMITLTYPADWVTVCPDGAKAKKHLEAFRKRLTRYLAKRDIEFNCLWFLEFQSRGAPHFHLLIWGEGLKDRMNIKNLRSHVSRGWASIVNHPDKNEYQKHLKAGTRVEKVRKEHFGYAMKYAAKPEQKEVPEGFQDVGRFWGIWNIKRTKGITLNFGLTPSTYYHFYDFVFNHMWHKIPEKYRAKLVRKNGYSKFELSTFLDRLHYLFNIRQFYEGLNPDPSFSVTLFTDGRDCEKSLAGNLHDYLFRCSEGIDIHTFRPEPLGS